MTKILLLCAAGMSTSMVVKKMLQAASQKQIDVKVDARPVDSIHDHLNDYDLFLLGPQVSFKHAELQTIAAGVNKQVVVINMMDYGMLNGEKILDDALALLQPV